MHARGVHSPPTELVVIDGIKAAERGIVRDTGLMRVYLSVEEAEKLQRQLGVAIREAIGQTELLPRTHGDLLDQGEAS